MKKGFVFTMDTVIAIILLLSVMVVVSALITTQLSSSSFFYEQLHYTAGDAMQVMSEQDTLDWIGTYWVEGECKTPYDNENCTAASSLAKDSLNEILPANVGYRFRFGNDTIYESSTGRPSEPSSTVTVVAHRIASGYEIGKPLEGYKARAFISNINNKGTLAFAYFGGYVGEGNITRYIELPNDFEIGNVSMELDAGANFTLYINGNYSGFYNTTNPSNMRAEEWEVPSAYYSKFHSGNNTLELKFDSADITEHHIGGGFLKVTYNTSQMDTAPGPGSRKYEFPGVYGYINLYSSFYAPENLHSMRIHLKYFSNFTTYLTIGNTTVFRNSSSDVTEVDISNSTLASLLDYDYLSGKNVPVRLGLENVPYEEEFGTGSADVMLVNDNSGSMEWCADYVCDITGTSRPFNYCHTNAQTKNETGTYCEYIQEDWVIPGPNDNVCSMRWNSSCPGGQKKLDIVVEATDGFIDAMLNTTENRLGLVEYTNNYQYVIPEGGVWSDKYAPYLDSINGRQNLTISKSVLKNHVDTYMDAYWGTCICCGVNIAMNMLDEQSNQSRNKSIVVMSDGEANAKCWQQGSGNAKQDAIDAAHEACNDYGMDVYTVGFGVDVDEETLQQMACGEGAYYNASDVDDLINIYKQIAQQIASIGFHAQRINITGNVSLSSVYPESFVEYNYTPAQDPLEFGKISLTMESPRFGGNITAPYKNGTFAIPSGITVVDSRVTSYSSEKWTDRVIIKNVSSGTWHQVFWLADYSTDYGRLGDPYTVNLPSEYIEAGKNNSVGVGTGLLPENATGGSPDDRVIYVARISERVGYGRIFANESDAVDDATARLNQSLTEKGIDINLLEIQANSTYASKIPALWGPARLTLEVWR